MGQSETSERALSLVGQGYIYGAKGQTCNPSFRRGQATQYPDQAARIMGEGAKWDGMPVWDCAQLTRTAAAYGGVTLPSGATSQWTRGPWRRKGTIDTLPTGEVVFLYRESGGKMQHTGVALGDGTEVDARGTSAGVVRKGVGEYPWTHWASPWDGASPDEDNDKEDESMATIGKALVTTDKDPLRVRDAPDGRKIGELPRFSTVDVLDKSDSKWWHVSYEGMTGYASAAYLMYMDDLVLRSDQMKDEKAGGVVAEALPMTTLMRDDGVIIVLAGIWRVASD